jgi:segregation and condensation protein B
VETSLENLQTGPVRETVLSQPAIDCLALIAYQPNILREELEKQLGQNLKPILTQLEKRGLITEVDSRYTTSDRFLEIVGLDSLDDLPHSSL